MTVTGPENSKVIVPPKDVTERVREQFGIHAFVTGARNEQTGGVCFRVYKHGRGFIGRRPDPDQIAEMVIPGGESHDPQLHRFSYIID